MEGLLELDSELFCWINHHHCGVADWLLWTASQAWSWALILVGLWCYLSFVVTRRSQVGIVGRVRPTSGQSWWLILTGIALCFLLSDRISVLCFKDVFQRLRPCHALEDVRMFRTTCGGRYGFVSSHAANIFSLVLFLSLWYRRMAQRRGWGFIALLFGWALVVGYSRPYLGKHYPGDVVCGDLLGLIIGGIVYWIISKIAARVSSK